MLMFFSRRNSYSFIVEAVGLKYIGLIKYKNTYIKKITRFLIVLFFEMDIPHCFAFCCNNEYTLHTYIHDHALQHFHTS